MTMVCDGPVIDSVTRPRHSSGKMSGSRNPNTQRDAYPEGTNGWHCAQPQSADVCYYCRLRFSPGQMRYRIMQALPSGWGPALLCMDCFKAETDESCLGYGATRHTIRCSGCNEYINTIRNPRYRQWRCCSNRCYQRDYRKRRRGLRSVVEWKCRQPKCKACHKPFQPSRTDAVYCSSGCRQWTYRRRIWANQRRNSPPRKRRRVHDLKRQ
jgi:hypothetical protein